MSANSLSFFNSSSTANTAIKPGFSVDNLQEIVLDPLSKIFGNISQMQAVRPSDSLKKASDTIAFCQNTVKAVIDTLEQTAVETPTTNTPR